MFSQEIWVKFLMCILMLMTCCLTGLSQDDSSVSLIQLIANPEKYDGKQVEVIGFLRLEFEGNALFLHQEDYEHRICRNAIGIGVTKEMKWHKDDVNMHYVLLVGTFRTGESSTYSGTIENPTALVLWPRERPTK
jgi:hypothetical protein